MKLLLPTLKKLRIVYAFLLLRACNQGGIIRYSDVQDALAMANITPSKYTVKRYLMMMDSHEPKLLRFYKPGLQDMYYRILAYVAYDDGSIEQIGIKEVAGFKNELIAVLHDLDADYATVGDVVAGGSNAWQN